MKLDKSLRTKLMKSPLVILTLISLVISGGFAAYVMLWQRSPSMLIATKGFDAMVVDVSLTDVLEPVATVTEATVLIAPYDDTESNTRRCAAIRIHDIRGLEPAQIPHLLVDMTTNGNWYVTVEILKLVDMDVSGSMYDVQDYLVDPNGDPMGLEYVLNANNEILWDQGTMKRFIHIEFEIHQTGEVTEPIADLVVQFELKADMYEPA